MKRTSIHSSEHAVLIGLLKELRLSADLSQAQVAERLGRPQTYVSAVEVGDRGLDLLQVRELAAVYGLDFPTFAKELEERIGSPAVRPRRRKRTRVS